MAVQNTLQKKNKADKVVEYDANGEKIKLSPSIIRKYLVSGNGKVTDEEVMMFLSMCRFQHLNPFLREAYLIKYGDNNTATMVTGKDVFLKRAKRNANFAGKEAGIIVIDEDGTVTEREGTFYLPNETIIGGWARVFVKGYQKPEYISVPFEEYAGRKKDGSLNSQWASKPATMIRKVALAQALREAFPEDFNGLYAPEEIPETADFIVDEPVPQPEIADEDAKVEDASDVFFEE